MNRNQLGFDHRPPSTGSTGILARLTGAVGALVGLAILTAVIVLGLMVSVFVIPVVLVIAAVIAGYLWFKTRTIRRELREQMQAYRETHPSHRTDESGGVVGRSSASTGQGKVIDGDDYIQEATTPNRKE